MGSGAKAVILRAPNSISAVREGIAVAAQAARVVPRPFAPIGPNGDGAVLRQPVCGAIIPLKATTPEHVRATLTGLKATQAVLGQLLAVYPLRQRSGLHCPAMAHSFFAALFIYLIILNRRAVDLTLFLFVLLLVVDDRSDHSQTQDRGRDAGIASIVGMRRCCCNGGKGHRDSRDCADQTRGKHKTHDSVPFGMSAARCPCCGVQSKWMHGAQTGNNTRLLSDNRHATGGGILYISQESRIVVT
jgi:hypothetical protein